MQEQIHYDQFDGHNQHLDYEDVKITSAARDSVQVKPKRTKNSDGKEKASCERNLELCRSARTYCESGLGFRLFPSNGNKRPLGRPGYQLQATSRIDGILGMLSGNAAAFGFLVLTGEALAGGGYLAVIDVDTKSDGLASLVRLLAALNIELPATATVRTGSEEPGRHIYFRTEKPLLTRYLAAKGYPGVEVKGAYAAPSPNTAYVIGAGSFHSSGRRYEWEPGRDLESVGIAKMPDAMINFLGETPCAASASASASASTPPDHDSVVDQDSADATGGLRLTRCGNAGELAREMIKKFPCDGINVKRNDSMGRAVLSLAGRGFTDDTIKATLDLVWAHFYSIGTTKTSRIDHNRGVAACITRSKRNRSLKPAIGNVDHIASCLQIIKVLQGTHHSISDPGCLRGLYLCAAGVGVWFAGLAGRTGGIISDRSRSFIVGLAVQSLHNERIGNIEWDATCGTRLLATDNQIANLANAIDPRHTWPDNNEASRREKVKWVKRIDGNGVVQDAAIRELLIEVTKGNRASKNRAAAATEYEITGLADLIDIVRPIVSHLGPIATTKPR